LVVPLFVGGQVRYSLSIASVRHERCWPRDLARRLGVVGGTIANAIERARSEHALRDREAMLQQANSDLLRAEDRERRRIAVALHDELAQNLFAAMLRVKTLRNMPSHDRDDHALDSVSEILQSTLAQARDLVFELCPPILYQAGLVPALDALCEKMSARYGLQCRLQNKLGPDVSINADLSSLIYQAVRELLMNVVKHAQAAVATVEIQSMDDQLIVSVEDDGVGYSAPQSSSTSGQGGFGLFHIRERLREMGGQMEIVSAPSGGCTVRLVVLNSSGVARERHA